MGRQKERPRGEQPQGLDQVSRAPLDASHRVGDLQADGNSRLRIAQEELRETEAALEASLDEMEVLAAEQAALKASIEANEAKLRLITKIMRRTSLPLEMRNQMVRDLLAGGAS